MPIDNLLNKTRSIGTIDNIDTLVFKSKKTKANITCPYCGESYYIEKFCTTTAVYYPPIYKNGVNINPDRNTSTKYCTCLNCKQDFNYTE